MFGKQFTKLSLFFFGGLAKLLLPRFRDLPKTLTFANINEDAHTYLSNILFLSFFFGLVLIFLMIFVMLKLNILFNLFSFILLMIISFTFAGLLFLVLYNYPKFVVLSNKKRMEGELEASVRHLSALQDPKLGVKDVLLLLQEIDNNKLLTAESKKILAMADLNKNLIETLNYICDTTYSEQEHNFFLRLVDVLEGKAKLEKVINDYMTSTEQITKEKEEQKKSRITLLFEINIFLFFLVFILIFSIFLIPVYQTTIKDILFVISIVFPIMELILIFILNK